MRLPQSFKTWDAITRHLNNDWAVDVGPRDQYLKKQKKDDLNKMDWL